MVERTRRRPQTFTDRSDRYRGRPVFGDDRQSRGEKIGLAEFCAAHALDLPF